MNIAMFSNLYLPLVGGVPYSIATFKREFEQMGHKVLVVTPELDEPRDDPDVVEVPAVQNFNGSDFPMAVPVPGYLSKTLEEFSPDLVHTHHPFLLGDTALRTAISRDRPLVFTYHTMWEHYLHYAPADSPAMQEFVKQMAAAYCDLCDHVITPSESIAEILRERGVTTPITALPTGIETDRFRNGDAGEGRRRLGIPADAPVAGYIGRLGPEKNLGVVADALIEFCRRRPSARALVVGYGEDTKRIRGAFEDAGLADRLYMPGTLSGQELIDAYHALDVFVFASRSETQGLVLAEAMAAGRPVVAVDAAGARDVVRDGENGHLIPSEDPTALADAILAVIEQHETDLTAMQKVAVATAEELSSSACAARAVELYNEVLRHTIKDRTAAESAWARSLRVLEAEWNLWRGRVEAAAAAAKAAEEQSQ